MKVLLCNTENHQHDRHASNHPGRNFHNSAHAWLPDRRCLSEHAHHVHVRAAPANLGVPPFDRTIGVCRQRHSRKRHRSREAPMPNTPRAGARSPHVVLAGTALLGLAALPKRSPRPTRPGSRPPPTSWPARANSCRASIPRNAKPPRSPGTGRSGELELFRLPSTSSRGCGWSR